MIGCSEFCGYYDWTFEWLRREAGDEAVERYWAEAIAVDSQSHAADLIIPGGIQGMAEYWGHTLEEEEAGYVSTFSVEDGYFRVDMNQCPSRGYNLEHGYEYYHDYCDHCMGWIKVILDQAGFVIHHDHNHAGQCWWEMRPRDADPGPSGPGELAGDADVRLDPDYRTERHHTWRAGERQ